jgi:methyl-accepting chemotaxis protein
MTSRSKYSLQRTMITYFLLIGFAALLVGLEFVAETGSGRLNDELSANLTAFAGGALSADEALAPIQHLRSKALLMVVIILFVIIIVLTMFIKHITEPLQHMIDVSRAISCGDLRRTIEVHSHNELSQLGDVINEMSSNLQEITLMSRNLCTAARAYLATASAVLEAGAPPAVLSGGVPAGDDEDPLRTTLAALGSEIDTLADMVAYFNFYTLDGTGDD